MKKYLSFLWVALMVTSLVFISCSDDDENQYSQAIVGKWRITAVKMSQSGSYVNWPFKTTYATFKSDGTYYGSGYFGTGSGTWSIKGNTVNTYIEGELYASYEIIALLVSYAELKMVMDGEAVWIECQKE